MSGPYYGWSQFHAIGAGKESAVLVTDDAIAMAYSFQATVGHKKVRMRQSLAHGEAKLMLVHLSVEQAGNQIPCRHRLGAGAPSGLESFGMMVVKRRDPFVQPVEWPVMGGQDERVVGYRAEFFQALKIQPQRIALRFIALQADIGGDSGQDLVARNQQVA